MKQQHFVQSQAEVIRIPLSPQYQYSLVDINMKPKVHRFVQPICLSTIELLCSSLSSDLRYTTRFSRQFPNITIVTLQWIMLAHTLHCFRARNEG